MTSRPLHGVRILDFSRLLAGPYATRIFADFGAEIIKIQSKKMATGAERNTNTYFATWNRNKLSVTIDLSSIKGRDLVLKLAAISDIIIENFTPRVMDNWGLTYEAFKKKQQSIIMVSMSAMGHDGPWRNIAALGPTIQALSGITYLTSYNAKIPIGIGYAYADIVAGLYAAYITLAALEHRTRTGQGQYIDISEFETMCTHLGPALLDVIVNDADPIPHGNKPQGRAAAPYGCYRCKGDDRWCVIAVFNDQQWQAMCHVIDKPALSNDTRFNTLLERQQHVQSLDELVEDWTSLHAPEEVTLLLQSVGVPASTVQNAYDLVNDPQLNARGFFTHITHPILGTQTLDASPIKLSETPANIYKSAPLLGEHNHYVFKELLQLSDKQIDEFCRAGIIA